MRITFVLPEADLSGGVRVVATYAELLRRRRHDVFVVSVPRVLPTVRERARRLLRERRWRTDRSSHLDRIDVEHRVLDTRRAVVDGDVPDADVVVATWWETAEQVARLSPSKGAKVSFLQGDETAFYPPEDTESRGRVTATLRLPMRRIAVSRWIAQRCQPHTDREIVVIHNGVDHGLFNAPPRAKAPAPTVGTIFCDPAFKGFDVAREAVGIARARRPDLRWVVFGSTLPGRRLALDTQTTFSLRPAQNDIPRLYAACDAWLFPSIAEGFGLPVLEAMACRTPVIASPAGIAPEIVPEGGGMLLDAPDPTVMAAAILAFASLTDEQWRVRSRAAFDAAALYTWDDAVRRFEGEVSAAARAHTSHAAALNRPAATAEDTACLPAP
jgi:glycosyltransferase involved in cell wall biosynthesis